jgi:hypothetical protein
MKKDDIRSYNELLDWIEAMRKACRSTAQAPLQSEADGDVWPVLPASAEDLVRRF